MNTQHCHAERTLPAPPRHRACAVARRAGDRRRAERRRSLGRHLVDGHRRSPADGPARGRRRTRTGRAAAVHAEPVSAEPRARGARIRALHQSDAAPDRPHQRRRLAAADRAQQPLRHRAARHRRRARRAPRQRRRDHSRHRPQADLQRRRRRSRFRRARWPSAIPSICGSAAADLAIDLFLPGDTNTPSPLTMHSTAVQTSYVSEPGNHAGAAKLPAQATTQNWFVIHRVDVLAPASVGGIVAYGDSITDGTRSTPDTNNRWPDHLVRRMLAQTPPLRMGVMNAAIAGNRVLSDANFQAGINALARFDHHVAAQPGADARDLHGRHQRHRPGAREPDAVGRGCDRRPQAGHRAGARAGAEDLRRHADAVLRRRLLHRGRRGEAAGRQSVDSDQQRLRRGDRFRQGHARSGRSEEVPGGLRLVRSPAPERRRDTRRWRTRSTSLCSRSGRHQRRRRRGKKKCATTKSRRRAECLGIFFESSRLRVALSEGRSPSFKSTVGPRG